MQAKRLTLANLCEGQIQKKIDRALEKVVRNILDPNMDPEKKRSITLKITLKPDSVTTDIEVTADVSVNLAPEAGVKTRLFVQEDFRGNTSVMEHKAGEIIGQLDFADMGYTIDRSDSEEDEESEDGSGIDWPADGLNWRDREAKRA